MKLVPLGLLVALFWPGTGHAAGARPPRYDEDALCGARANTVDGFSADLEQKCFQNQDDALDAVKRLWEQTPDYIRQDCDRRARVEGDPDYEILRNCMRDQLRQALPGTGIAGISLSGQ